jgi:hypothetical protein
VIGSIPLPVLLLFGIIALTFGMFLVLLLRAAGKEDRDDARREQWIADATTAGFVRQERPGEIWGIRLPAFSIEAFTGWVPDQISWPLWLEKKERGRWVVWAEYSFARSDGGRHGLHANGTLFVFQLEHAVKPFFQRDGTLAVESDGEWIGVWTPAGVPLPGSFAEYETSARRVAARALEAHATVLQPV